MKIFMIGLIFLVLTAVSGLAGCNPAPVTKVAVVPAHEEHAHHGPHGGHIMEIGAEEFHAEWVHDDSGKVTFYILDAEAKKEVPIAAEEMTIEVKIGANPPATYKLAAVNPMEMKASAFEIVDKNLVGVLETLSEGVTATIKELKIGDKTFSDLKIEEHKH